MKDGQPQAIELSDYEKPGYSTDATDLIFDIEDGVTTVTSTLRIARQVPDATALRLDGQDLELVSVRLDGQLLSSNQYQVDDESLQLFGLESEHEIQIVTRVHPESNTALEGLYRSSKMYCTQCEAEGFRKITYYQDRPDVLSKFTTTIRADALRYPTLLSNGNRVAKETLPDGRTSVTWEDPFPKPSYLFALVAGDLRMIEDEFITKSGRHVTLRIFSEAHNIDQCHYAMEALKRAMSWDERRFGREYDLDVFMIVAVEDFNMGAMENKGLNIFNTSCVLATPDTATDAAYQRVEAVVAHEYFHNWSGNRVTCRDWFQLSLKEGFTVFRDAEFSADMNSRPVKRIEDVGFLRSVQFAEDAGPLAHPVRPQSYIEISNFYTTTIYEKGAEVVRMYHTLLGAEKFRAATDLYFERFDGCAATTDDFADVMAEVGAVDLTQFRRWYEQAGTPLLTVTESFDQGEFVLHIAQSCRGTPGQPEKLPFHMPLEVGLLDREGAGLSFYDLVVDSTEQVVTRHHGQTLMISLRNPEAQLRFSYLPHKPVVSFLRGFSAPVKVEYEQPSGELAFLAQHDSDGFVRWDALQSLWVRHFSGMESDGTDLPALLREIAEQALHLTEDAEAKLLAAAMLSVPTENYLFEQLKVFEVDALLDARERVLDDLAGLDVWDKLYHACRAGETFIPDARGQANRALAGIAFAAISRAMTGQPLREFVMRHYDNADNLTDRRAALEVVCRHPGFGDDERRRVLERFFTRWEREALVLDLWFSLQAQSPLSTLQTLRELEANPRFELSNPNRVRAVFAVFGLHNPRRFHAADGSGYAYLTDAIAKLDPLNPQLAARLASPLTRWQRYDSERQQLMQAQLQRLLSKPGLSKDLYEIVAKSVEAEQTAQTA